MSAKVPVEPLNEFELAIYNQKKINDYDYAKKLYCLLENSYVFNLKGELIAEYGMRDVACMIADLRGNMDDYCQFFCTSHNTYFERVEGAREEYLNQAQAHMRAVMSGNKTSIKLPDRIPFEPRDLSEVEHDVKNLGFLVLDGYLEDPFAELKKLNKRNEQ